MLAIVFVPVSVFAADNALKIAILTSPNDVNDGGFCQNNYNGILDFIKEYPDSTVTPLQEKTGDVAAAINLL